MHKVLIIVYICKMKYENIKKAGITTDEIAMMFGYKTTKSFRSSSAHKRHMKGIDELIGKVMDKVIEKINTINK